VLAEYQSWLFDGKDFSCSISFFFREEGVKGQYTTMPAKCQQQQVDSSVKGNRRTAE